MRQQLTAIVLAVALGACASSEESGASTTEADARFDPITTAPTFAPLSTTTTTATTAEVGSPPTVPDPSAPAPGTSTDLDALLAQLVIAPEEHGSSYERARFEHWIDADGDGCHTRCEVLAAERHAALPGLPGGGWVSIYDGYTTDDPSELEIDHVVALSEAWRSGASEWDDTRRRAFANDLDEPGALRAVTSATNRAKSDKDPAEWQPPNRDAWCDWGLGWVRTKVKWGLTADEAEVRALGNILRGC